MRQYLQYLVPPRHIQIFIGLTINWLLINVLFCLLPLIISALLNERITNSIISSLVSYSFTLTISSIYLFEKFGKPRNPLKWTGVFLAFLFLGFYVYFPDLANIQIKQFITRNSIWVCSFVLGVTLLITYVLNFKSLWMDAKGESEGEKFKRASTSGPSEKDFKEQLNQKSNG